MNKKHFWLALALFIGVVSCSSNSMDEKNNKAITVSIMGSAEKPDPVLQRVQELERQGVVSGVMIMKSWPLQIRLTAPADIVKELEAIPRKTLDD